MHLLLQYSNSSTVTCGFECVLARPLIISHFWLRSEYLGMIRGVATYTAFGKFGEVQGAVLGSHDFQK